jgi:hypothetical protein
MVAVLFLEQELCLGMRSSDVACTFLAESKNDICEVERIFISNLWRILIAKGFARDFSRRRSVGLLSTASKPRLKRKPFLGRLALLLLLASARVFFARRQGSGRQQQLFFFRQLLLPTRSSGLASARCTGTANERAAPAAIASARCTGTANEIAAPAATAPFPVSLALLLLPTRSSGLASARCTGTANERAAPAGSAGPRKLLLLPHWHSWLLNTFPTAAA